MPHYTTAPPQHDAWRDAQKAAFKAGEAAPPYPAISDDEIRETIEKNQLRLIRDRTLICEVADASPTSPHLRRAHAFDEGGRGLLLVAQLTQRWGSRHTDGGKTIWAEQPLPQP